MAVEVPVVGAEMNFHVSDDAAALIADLQYCVREVWAGSGVPLSGAYDAHGLAAPGQEVGRPNPVIIPDGLNMAFGDAFHAAALFCLETDWASGVAFTFSTIFSAVAGFSFR